MFIPCFSSNDLAYIFFSIFIFLKCIPEYRTGCMPACSVSSVMSDSLWSYGLYLTRLLSPWDAPGKNTTVGCHALLQGIFLTQRLNPCLLHLLNCRWILLPLSHWESPIGEGKACLRDIIKILSNLFKHRMWYCT